MGVILICGAQLTRFCVTKGWFLAWCKAKDCAGLTILKSSQPLMLTSEHRHKARRAVRKITAVKDWRAQQAGPAGAYIQAIDFLGHCRSLF